MIKGNGVYAVNGVYAPTTNAIDEIQKTEPLLLPSVRCEGPFKKRTSPQLLFENYLVNPRIG